MERCYGCKNQLPNDIKVKCNCGHFLCEYCTIQKWLSIKGKVLLESIWLDKLRIDCHCSKGFGFIQYSTYTQIVNDIINYGLETTPQEAKCEDHTNNSKEFYCKQCKCLICNQCFKPGSESKSKHIGHKYITEQLYINKKINKMKYRKYPSYKIYEDAINQMQKNIMTNIDKRIKEEVSLLTSEVNRLIDIKERYISAINKKKKEIIIMFNILKQNGSILFNEYSKKTFQAIQLINSHKLEIQSIDCIYDNNRSIKQFDTFIEDFENTLLQNAAIEINIHEAESIIKPSKSFIGHKGSVYSVVQISDSQIASCSEDHTIKIWNINDCSCVTTLLNHRNSVTSLIQLKDGRLVSCSEDNTITIWELETPACTTLSDNNGMTIFSICEVMTNTLASSSNDKLIKLWDLVNNKYIRSLIGHSDAVYSLIKLSDGRMCSCSGDKTIKVWNMIKGECELTLVGHEKPVYSLCEYLPGQIASCSGDCTIRKWNLNLRESIIDNIMRVNISVIGHNGGINSITKIDEHRIASGGNDDIVKIWDIKTLKTTNVLIGQHHPINGIICLNNGDIVACSSSYEFKLWRVNC